MLEEFRFQESFRLNGDKMKELSKQVQQEINGGSSLVYVISSIIIAAGAGFFKIMRSRFITRR